MSTPDFTKITQLCRCIEDAAGWAPHTPKDFHRLNTAIYTRMHAMVSVSTLMRLWGYIDGNVAPRRQTLDILSQFIGYRDWDAFCNDYNAARQSGIVLSRRINVMADLTPGDNVRLTWPPGRECVISYLGAMRFKIEHSVNTRLKKGDTFLCALIIDGEPLYLDDLRQSDAPPTGYVCGRRNGIRFSIL